MPTVCHDCHGKYCLASCTSKLLRQGVCNSSVIAVNMPCDADVTFSSQVESPRRMASVPTTKDAKYDDDDSDREEQNDDEEDDLSIATITDDEDEGENAPSRWDRSVCHAAMSQDTAFSSAPTFEVECYAACTCRDA